MKHLFYLVNRSQWIFKYYAIVWSGEDFQNVAIVVKIEFMLSQWENYLLRVIQRRTKRKWSLELSARLLSDPWLSTNKKSAFGNNMLDQNEVSETGYLTLVTNISILVRPRPVTVEILLSHQQYITSNSGVCFNQQYIRGTWASCNPSNTSSPQIVWLSIALIGLFQCCSPDYWRH